jgi:chromosome segregation ATPase
MDAQTNQLLIGLAQALLVILGGVALTIQTNAKINAAKKESDEKRREETTAVADKFREQYEADRLKTAEAYRQLLQTENERSNRFERVYQEEIKKNDALWLKISEFRTQQADNMKRIAVLESHEANFVTQVADLTARLDALKTARDEAVALVEKKNGELRDRDVQIERQRGEIAALTQNVARLEDQLQDALLRITTLETKTDNGDLDPSAVPATDPVTR